MNKPKNRHIILKELSNSPQFDIHLVSFYYHLPSKRNCWRNFSSFLKGSFLNSLFALLKTHQIHIKHPA